MTERKSSAPNLTIPSYAVPLFIVVAVLFLVPGSCLAQGFTIATIAGNTTPGYSGDGGPAIGAQLFLPQSVAFDAAGNLYIADTFNNVVREVTLDGIIMTIAGNGTFGYSGDGSAANAAQLAYPHGLAFDSAGDLFIADTSNNVIREITPDGNINTVVGDGTPGYTGDAGPPTAAELYAPYAVALDSAGDLYITDSNNNVIREVVSTGPMQNAAGEALLSGIIQTVGGNGYPGYSGDGGPFAGAQFYYPKGLAIDAAGNLYIADFGNSVIRKVAVNGTITTVAGNGAPGYLGDGSAATNAELNFPEDVAVDSKGDLYIADTINQVIREVLPSGVISTVAGNGIAGYAGDGGPATNAEFFNPKGVAVNTTGSVYVADWDNQVIRQLTPTGK